MARKKAEMQVRAAVRRLVVAVEGAHARERRLEKKDARDEQKKLETEVSRTVRCLVKDVEVIESIIGEHWHTIAASCVADGRCIVDVVDGDHEGLTVSQSVAVLNGQIDEVSSELVVCWSYFLPL